VTRQVVLAGCTPVPLVGYLKALGVLRLVAEQADPDARGYWENEQFVLQSRLDEVGLRRFFLEEYEATPVIAPWNGGSGFYPKDNKSGIKPIESGNAKRFHGLSRAIAVAKTSLGQLGLEERPAGDSKQELLALLRASLDDAAVAWLDAAILLTESGPKYPPLLGTGGNDGRLDFTNNFMQHLVALFDPDSGQASATNEALLQESLYGEATPGMSSAKIGQFAPSDAGGVNQTSGFEARSLVNSWDFVLMLEGAVLFAASATRRLESGSAGALSYPFTVHLAAGGSGAAALSDEGAARAEIWMPLWSKPVGFRELEALLSEGRVTLGRQAARDGLDFSRAVARLGVDRGIDAFQRYAFLMRSGKAYFATPLNRVTVTRNPAADLIDELDERHWLSRFRRYAEKEGSHQVQILRRNLEAAIFSLTTGYKDTADSTRRLLICLGEIALYFARSPKAREACPPIPRLSRQWVTQAEPGGGLEFSLAAALAGLQGKHSGNWIYPMRLHLLPEKPGRYQQWDEQAGHRITWAEGTLEANLAATLQRRLLDIQHLKLDDKPLVASRTASTAHVAAWLAGQANASDIAALLLGLMLARIPSGRVSDSLPPLPLPGAYRLLKPFFVTDTQLHRAGLLPAERKLPLPGDMVRRLAAGQIRQVLPPAMRLLRVAGLYPGKTEPAAGIQDGRLLLAALMVPISDHDLQRLWPREWAQENQQAS